MRDVTAEVIAERHRSIVARLSAAAERGGHDPARLRVVAITKTHPIAVVRAARDAGLAMLGESRVQEAEPKLEAVPDAEWHLVGRLQSNKARRAVRAFAVIHSIDSHDLLRRVDEVAAEEGRAPRVLLQVNVSGEASKAGLDPSSLRDVRDPSTVRLVGLMTIAPMGVDETLARDVFGHLRVLRDELARRLGRPLAELSMGMSADADAAAAEGATLVRIGTALFGPRD